MLTPEQRAKLKAAGYSDTKINVFEAQKAIKQKEAEAQQPGYVDRLKGAFQERKEEVKDINSSNVSLPEKILQNAGQIAGGAADIVTELPVIKQGLELTGKVISKVPGVEKAGELYNKLPERARDNIEAVGNIASLVPVGMGAKGSIVAGEKALATGAKAGKVVKNATKNVASKVVPDSTAIMQRVARIPKSAQAKFKQTAGQEVGEYLAERNIFGNQEKIVTQLFDRFTTSKNAADDALGKLTGTYKTKPVETALKELLSRETRISSPGALSQDFKRVRELSNKYKKAGLEMKEINEVKRLFERNIRLDFVKQNLPEGVAKANTIDDALRTWQFSQAEKLGLKNLPEINKETRLAKQLMDAIGKETAGSAGNNVLSLTDYILLAGGDPAAIATFIGKKIFDTKGLQSSVAKRLYKGKKTGKPEAKFGTPKPGLEEFMNRK